MCLQTRKKDTCWASWTRESSAPFCRSNSMARCSIPGSLQMKKRTVEAQLKTKETSMKIRQAQPARPCADSVSQALVRSLPVSKCLVKSAAAHTPQNQGIPEGKHDEMYERSSTQKAGMSTPPVASGFPHQHPLLPAVLPLLFSEPRTRFKIWLRLRQRIRR